MGFFLPGSIYLLWSTSFVILRLTLEPLGIAIFLLLLSPTFTLDHRSSGVAPGLELKQAICHCFGEFLDTPPLQLHNGPRLEPIKKREESIRLTHVRNLQQQFQKFLYMLMSFAPLG